VRAWLGHSRRTILQGQHLLMSPIGVLSRPPTTTNPLRRLGPRSRSRTYGESFEWCGCRHSVDGRRHFRWRYPHSSSVGRTTTASANGHWRIPPPNNPSTASISAGAMFFSPPRILCLSASNDEQVVFAVEVARVAGVEVIHQVNLEGRFRCITGDLAPRPRSVQPGP